MSRLLRILALVIIGVLVLATPVMAYLYQAPLTVTETTGVAYTNIGVTATVDNDWLATNGFMAATGLDTRVSTLAGAARKHMVVDDRTLAVIPTVTGNSQTNLYYSTGNSALTSMPIIPGYNGYVTIIDHANLEFGSQFIQEFVDLWVTANTTVNNSIIKTAAWRVCTSDKVAGIAAYVPVQASHIVVDAAGVSNATISGANWESQTFTATATTLISGLTMSTLIGGGAGTMVASLRATAAGLPTGADLAVSPSTSVGGASTQFTFNCPYKVTNGTVYAIVLRGTFVTADPVGKYNNANPYAGGQRCSSADSGVTWAGVGADDYRMDVENSLGVMTNTGITTGEYDIVIEADTINLTMDIASVEVDSRAIGGGVPNNANNWILLSNASPYLGEYSHTTAVGGVSEKISYLPNAIIIGTALPNRAVVGSYNGAFTFGANPAGLTVVLGSMIASGTSVGAVASTPTPDILAEVTVSDWYETADVTGSLLTNPMRPFVTIMSDTTALTEIQAWRFFGLVFVLLVTVGSAVAIRGHLLIAGVACCASIIALTAMTIWPFWTLIFAIGAIVAGMLSERTPVV